jgi:hypothetical protein
VRIVVAGFAGLLLVRALFIFVLAAKYRDRGIAPALVHGSMMLLGGVLALVAVLAMGSSRYAIGACGAVLVADLVVRQVAWRGSDNEPDDQGSYPSGASGH